MTTPNVAPRTHLHDPPEPLSEVTLIRYGALPVRALMPSNAVTAASLRMLEGMHRDLPRLSVGSGDGAIDVRLEDPTGAHVKSGTVMLEDTAARRRIEIPIDPTTRRFRAGNIPAGDYRLRAAAAVAGRGSVQVSVRDGDVCRTLVRLEGELPDETASVRLALAGGRSVEVAVRGTDKRSGRVVFDGVVRADNGLIQLDDVPFGWIHWDIDDGEASSCYDVENNNLSVLLDPLRVVLYPKLPDPLPDPPDWRFRELPEEFHGVARVLPSLGIRTMRQLAAAEPEDLMHRARRAAQNRRAERLPPVHDTLFAEAIDAARMITGAQRVEGESRDRIRLPSGTTYTRVFAARAFGESEFAIDLGPEDRAELVIRGPSGTERHTVVGSERIRLSPPSDAQADDIRYEIALTNVSEGSVTAVIRANLPLVDPLAGPRFSLPTVKDQIESIYRALAVRNPGLGTHQADAVMLPENIQMWIDRAQTLMASAGVCSINDLGRFRMEPARVLRTGAYVAPLKPQGGSVVIPALPRYAFSELINDTVLFYQPNDVLHDTAVVMAGEWDIRGQSVVIGHEVRELVVIVRSIRHDGGSKITWQTPPLPPAPTYWPNPAPSNAHGASPGAHGQDGGDGDREPHPSRNGGADAVTEGPIVTMYVLNATNNLPPIELRGQKGGTGNRGQDGGRGGDGAVGLRADGTFFGGCCREVGHGGNGGAGGDGGRGGKGGQGGRGGRVTLLTTAASIAALAGAPPAVDLTGGEGGDPGDGGNPGAGGSGGPAGTADCEPWCDEHPERRGANGARGADGPRGFDGEAGPRVVDDGFQVLPITAAQWEQELNKPHILDLIPDEAEPGQSVQVIGRNFDPAIDRVYFDGVNVGPVSGATQATFTVPLTTEGGYHPVVIRPAGFISTGRRSNRAQLRVVPKVDPVPPGTRWVENQNATLTGLGFRPGLQVLAEDRSATPVAAFALPVVGVTRTAINLQVPGASLGVLRGVRRIVVRNPDGGTSRDERVVRIGDTIVVRCAAFRVVGTSPGVGTTRSDAEIANLFIEGGVHSVSIPWAQARIAFRLVQPVQTVTVADDLANVWPLNNPAAEQNLAAAAPAVVGAMNFFFVRDLEIATARAYFGGGPLIIGDEGGPLGAVDWQQVVAHEIGHALCLRHICDGRNEGPGTFFNRRCGDGDNAFLMFPFWDSSDGMAIHTGQVDPARLGATHFEDGKTAALPLAALSQGNNNCPQCLNADAQN